MIRLSGVGTYGSDAFSRPCDELGLLVWQDFLFANLDYPVEDERFRTSVESEATAIPRPGRRSAEPRRPVRQQRDRAAGRR